MHESLRTEQSGVYRARGLTEFHMHLKGFYSHIGPSVATFLQMFASRQSTEMWRPHVTSLRVCIFRHLN